MSRENRPMGIMASFSKVSFKKDGAEVFSATVTSGGCFGPDDAVDVINRGYAEMNKAINSGALAETARDFNAVSVGAHNYEVAPHGKSRIEKSALKRVMP